MVGCQKRLSVSVSKCNSKESIVELVGDWRNLELFSIERWVLKLHAAKVGPKQSESLPASAFIEFLQSLTVFDAKASGERRELTLLEELRLYLGKTSLSFISSERFLKFSSSTESGKNATLTQIRLVFLEDVARTRDQDLFLGNALSAIPPLANQVRQDNSKNNSVAEQDVSTMALGDDPFRQGDANAETLLAVGVAILQVVVANLLISKCFESLCVFDPFLIDVVYGQVLCRVGLDFVGVVSDGEFAVERLDLLLRGRLQIIRMKSPSMRMRSYPGYSQNLIGIPDLGDGSCGYDHEIDHPSHNYPAAQGEQELAQLALLAAQLLALALNEIDMVGREVGLYSRGRVLKILAASEQRDGDRNGYQAGDGDDEVREELSLAAQSVGGRCAGAGRKERAPVRHSCSRWT